MMKKSLLKILFIFTLMCFISCSDENVQNNDSAKENEKNTSSRLNNDTVYNPNEIAVIEKNSFGNEYVSNILIVYFKSGTSDSDKNGIVGKINGEVVGIMDTFNQYQIKITSKSYDDLKKLCNEIESEDCVNLAIIDEVIVSDEQAYYPKDGYDDDWDEQPSGQNWSLEAIEAPRAWGYIEKMSPVKVAVVDSGFDLNHADLSDRIINSPLSDSPSAEPEHGTSVAGVVGACFDNGIGVSGEAPNAVITGYSIGEETITSTVVRYYVTQAVKDGNKIVNLSFGQTGNLSDYNSTSDYYDDGRRSAYEISSLLSQGYDFLVVQSAGNGAADGKGVNAVYNGLYASITADNCNDFEHSYEEIRSHIIIVGAAALSDSELYMDTYSNFGSNVDLCAPGTNIMCVVPEGKYGYSSGTSFSAPYVAGAAALVWGINPDFSAIEVKNLLCDSYTTSIKPRDDAPIANGVYSLLNVGLAVENAYKKVSTSEEELAFYSFLQEKYESADDYYNDHPIFYDRNGEGQISQYGGMTWIQYSIDDFDNDGYKEMLLLTTFYTGDTYSADAMGMLYMYEYVNGQVEIDNYCNFDGTLDLTSPEFMIKNSDVVYWERLSSGAYNLVVLPFSSENREKLGMKDGEYLVYGLGYYDLSMMSRMIVSGFSVNDIEDLPYDEYDAETGELLKGDLMTPVIHDVTRQGIAG